MPTIQTNDIESFYKSSGSGQPVILVHSATSKHKEWEQQAQVLCDDYQVIRYDLRDHGKTDPSNSEYHISQLASDLQQLILGIDVSDPIICGVSLGGAVAQRHAVSYGGGEGYVFANTFTPTVYSIRERLFTKIVPEMYLSFIDLFGYKRSKSILSSLRKIVIGDDHSTTERNGNSIQDDSVEFTDAEITRIYRAIQGWFGSDIDYSEICVPILVLYGGHEPDFMKTHAAVMGGRVSDSRIQEISQAGHKSHIDAPEAFNTQLVEFLEAI
jgi:pimeloyl-ACP methyl ester carboxylesterase